MGMMSCIAVDWSGAKTAKTQRDTIWLAAAEEGAIVDLTNGHTRDKIIDMLVDKIRKREAAAIGLDFAFSFPQWYLECRELPTVRELWKLARTNGEKWLVGDTWPFWGERSPYQPLPGNLCHLLQFRQTDRDHLDARPKSVFQISGVGHVGTGTIRGLPALACLQEAGAVIWPFDAAEQGTPIVVEIYPRLFYGNDVTKSQSQRSLNSRRDFLEGNYNHLEQCWKDLMIESPDAFDAGVSALHMSLCVEYLRGLEQETQPPTSLEGRIWYHPIP